MYLILILLAFIIIFIATAIVLWKNNQKNSQQHAILTLIEKAFTEHRKEFDARQLEVFKMQQDSQQKTTQDMRMQISEHLDKHSKNLNERMQALTQNTNERLKEISGQVEKRLTEGFEKTTQTFTDVVKRLALIDQAQKKITELSSNVVSLQSILNDKRSRGAFGEIQLNNLIRNVMPENTFELQHTLSNNKRCDCVLFLPEPTGNIVIDAKFPLETYRKLTEEQNADQEKRALEQQFRQDIKTHITHIAEKYILPGETADGAMMFIPAEAIFAEIHAHYPDVVEFSNQKRVWLVSPTTMMAVLTTARAVLKDADTRKQVHIIQEHLILLAKDFTRFQKRMDTLAKHIDQAHQDVSDVHTSAKKITSRFNKIESLEMESTEMIN
ncbi:MAG: DNA recombination protein RmuC [Gammaproteobacteria bacterium]